MAGKSWTSMMAAALLLSAAPAAFAGGAEKTLYTFASGYDNFPTAGIVADAAGNLYGTIEFGGNGYGFAFELSPNGKGQWTYSVIYNFTGRGDGAFPQGSLTFDSAGNLYGTAVGGGDTGPSLGTVFELSPGQNGSWSLTNSYSFTGGADGSTPLSGVTLDAAGNLYGTTSQGGAGYGAIYELTPSGNGWQETTIHDFAYGVDGGYPNTNLTVDRKGNVYGSVIYGGAYNQGYVFQYHQEKNGWNETVLHNFGDGAALGTSYGSLVLDKAGNLYGTMAAYNHQQMLWNGSIFELTKPSHENLSQKSWPITILYQFAGANGGFPIDLTFDKKGNIYGPDATGGANASGSIYKLTPSMNNGQVVWTQSTLYNFTGAADGCSPGPDVIFDKPESGQLFGVAESCGANGNGTVFTVKK